MMNYCGNDAFTIGAPVWHMHESLEWLKHLVRVFPTVCIGSSGQWKTPGTTSWWSRINDAFDSICDQNGNPKCRIHGLRMLDPAIFGKLPSRSADSTNAAVNSGSLIRFGMYVPPTACQRASVIADRIESNNSASTFNRILQEDIFMDQITPESRHGIAQAL
jgi:hypothetical protein